MATEFTFSITTDFPNQAVDASVLTAEINEAIDGSGITLEGINISGDSVVIEFSDDLTAPQETGLNAIIAAHQGQPFVMGIQSVTVEAEQTTTGTTFVEAASLVSGILAGGNYTVNWYCEVSVLTATANSGVLAQVMWNGTERAADANALEFYTSFSGSVIIEDVAPLAAPTLAINFRRAGVANTARIRRVRMSIVPTPSFGEDEE